MANPYINIYKDNPTEGAKDGTPVSTDGAYTAPITAFLNKDRMQSQIIKLAVRTEEGYRTLNDFHIGVYGVAIDASTSSLRYFVPGYKTLTNNGYTLLDENLLLSWTQNGEYKYFIATTESIGSTNKIFYAKFTMTDDEMPQIDKSRKLMIITSILKVD